MPDTTCLLSSTYPSLFTSLHEKYNGCGGLCSAFLILMCPKIKKMLIFRLLGDLLKFQIEDQLWNSLQRYQL